MCTPDRLIKLGVGLIVIGVMIPLAAYVATRLMPPYYTSAANVEVRSYQNTSAVIKASIFAPVGDYPGITDPSFIAGQIQLIRSGSVLSPAIVELGLTDKWSARLHTKLTGDETYQMLLKMVDVTSQKNTAVVRIAVTSTDRLEAANIANTIAVIYIKSHRDEQAMAVSKTIMQLKTAVDKQRDKTDQAQKEFERILARDNVQDPNPESADPPVSPPNPEYESAKKKYLDEKKRYLDRETDFSSYKMNFMINFTPAKTWDNAEPATEPSSPDVKRIMILAGAGGSLCAICGMGLVIAGVRLKRGRGSSFI